MHRAASIQSLHVPHMWSRHSQDSASGDDQVFLIISYLSCTRYLAGIIYTYKIDNIKYISVLRLIWVVL